MCCFEVTRGYKRLSKKYKETDYLASLIPRNFISQRDQCVVSFLSGLSGMDFDNENDNVSYAVATTIESLYHLRCFPLILPYSFMANLNFWFQDSDNNEWQVITCR